MRCSCVLFLGLSVAISLAQSIPNASTRNSALFVANYGRLPMAFEANRGQTDQQVKFLSRGAGYSLFLTPTEAVLALNESSQQEPAAPVAKAAVSRGTEAAALQAAIAPMVRDKKSAVLHMKLVGANARPDVRGEDELPGKSNYFIGNDPMKWHTNVPHFSRVRYVNVYPGVDLVFYGNQRELEYDFILQPEANPAAIRLGIEGAKKLRLEHGDLMLTSAAGDVHLCAPRIYQEVNGTRREVRGHYVMTSKNEVGFRIGAYDRRRALVIDPVLAYSTYLGGSRADWGSGISVDSTGHAYVTGGTGSADFPTKGAIQANLGGFLAAFVTKFNADGSGLVYSTYLGGNVSQSGNGSVQSGNAIAVDSAGNAYVTGYTDSIDFPTVNAIQPAYGGGDSDAFLTKINAAGSALVYSTYLGGSMGDGRRGADSGYGIAVDIGGDAFVAGVTQSSDFPTKNALQPAYGGGDTDAFVTKINATGSLVYSTYLGGSNSESPSVCFQYCVAADSVAVDSAGNAYVTGVTTSSDFPIKNAFQPAYHGGQNGEDAFVTKINATGDAFVYSTYLGGSGDDQATAIAADSAGNAYVTGGTWSTDFPTANAFQPSNAGNFDAFVTKIESSGKALVYSTYLGGANGDVGAGIALDSAGDAYITGITDFDTFPLVNPIDSKACSCTHAFVTKFSSSGSTLNYSTYLGSFFPAGIAVDTVGSAYVTGLERGRGVIITPLAFEQLRSKGGDAVVSKIAQQSFVSVSPAKLSFSSQVIGLTSKTKKVTVTNQGSTPLTINGIVIGGLVPNDFSETNTCGSSLPAGASCTISVTFKPTGKNKRQAGVGVSSPDPGSPNAIALSGIGTVVSLSTKNLPFGDQTVGTTSVPQNVTLKNVGSTPLNFTGITITGTNAGDFAQTNTCGTSIAAGASCTITVTFKPTAQGTRTAAVSISDDGGGSPQKVTLTGTGT